MLGGRKVSHGAEMCHGMRKLTSSICMYTWLLFVNIVFVDALSPAATNVDFLTNNCIFVLLHKKSIFRLVAASPVLTKKAIKISSN